MSCTAAALTVETYTDGRRSRSSSASPEERQPLMNRRRRQSYNTIRRHSTDFEADAVFLRVDLFLAELERRLDWLEKYRREQILQIDASLKRGYATLEAVRDSCSHVSGELMDAGRRRAKILVDTLEGRYTSAIATKETLEQKAQASMRLMDNFLTELEARAKLVRNTDLSAAIDEGWRHVNHGLERAHEAIDEGIDRARRAKEALRDSISHALSRAQETRLIRYEDLPSPWRVNPNILHGYRFTESKLECLTSAFNISNELVNIWSHALGFLIVLALAFYFYPTSTNFHHSTPTDVFIAAVFFFAACKCLVCSTMWHTMNCVAEQTLLERFACVDYAGISLLVAASIMTTEYTAFYCEPMSRYAYMTLTALLGIAGTILPWRPTFNRSDMAWARVCSYVLLAATGFAPVIQLNLTRGPEWSFYFYAPIAKSIAVYLIGACIYASQIPERFLPGWFDYAGGSHNIWHVAVVGGILFHYCAMQDFFAAALRRGRAGCSVY